MTDSIVVQTHANWTEITLNRPDRLNSFNTEMHLALRAALETARDGGVRAVLLTGAGRGFCAGQDLGDRDPSKMTSPPDLGETVRTYYGPLIKLIRSLEFPVVLRVALVNSIVANDSISPLSLVSICLKKSS